MASHVATAINAAGKWKTTLQMVSLTALLWARHPTAGPVAQLGMTLGPAAAAAAAALTAASFAIYVRGAFGVLFL